MIQICRHLQHLWRQSWFSVRRRAEVPVLTITCVAATCAHLSDLEDLHRETTVEGHVLEGTSAAAALTVHALRLSCLSVDHDDTTHLARARALKNKRDVTVCVFHQIPTYSQLIKARQHTVVHSPKNNPYIYGFSSSVKQYYLNMYRVDCSILNCYVCYE